MKPQIILLKESVDDSQGIPQLLSNISACKCVSDIIQTTLGPRGGDKLIVMSKRETTITNDGAEILQKLDIVNPAAKTLVDIAKSQDDEVGDGTTSVILLACELLENAKSIIEENVAQQVIIKGFKMASQLAIEKCKEISVKLDSNLNPTEFHEKLRLIAETSMNSKLIRSQKTFFSRLVVDAMLTLDSDLNEKMIGIKKVPGNGVEHSLLIKGIAFKKTFSYAGFEQQPKYIENPKIITINIELEIKSERDNAEIRINNVQEYQRIVDTEWDIIYEKLKNIHKSGANIVFSRLPIGDLATQYFADNGIFCAGRVASDDIERIINAAGGNVLSSVSNISQNDLGSCALFEEIRIGADRYNILKDGSKGKACTLILRGPSTHIINEVERSVHDALMTVKRMLINKEYVFGGGATEMHLSTYLLNQAKLHTGSLQPIILAFAKSLECIPRQLCENAGFNTNDIITKLRQKHSEGHNTMGVNIEQDGIGDNKLLHVWEPTRIKTNAISAATEAACLIISIDETVTHKQQQPTN